HGMSAEASVVKKHGREDPSAKIKGAREPFATPHGAFAPNTDSIFSQIEMRAVGSTLVLVALIAGIGYGGWAVLKEVQQVQFAPVEQAPVVLSDLDPLAEARTRAPASREVASGAPAAPNADALDRLYRPQALDVPVLVARDAPISTLDPRNVGSFAAPEQPVSDPRTASSDIDNAIAQALGLSQPETVASLGSPGMPQVVETPSAALQVVAVRTSWVRIRSSDGTVIFEKTMQPGETWQAPLTEEPPTLRTGESGAIYFSMNDRFYGPVGQTGAITSNLPLSVASLQETYLPVEIGEDEGLVRYAEARGLVPQPVTD
ncbi:MAG: DUF4115 domain-containing protein, partial [Pseudomonadota bacterium]|nr:DUF4115 domain-containing protein [Pseudomonadota bacterium]